MTNHDQMQNKPETKEGAIDFTKARSFDELYALIKEAGGVKGSDHHYSATELKGIIEDVRYYKLDEQHVPTEELRKTVIRLMQGEENMRSEKNNT